MESHSRISPQIISQQRVQYIVDSYILAGSEADAFNAYLSELFIQYPHGLIELALVETLVKNWLTIPMQKGVPFLKSAHDKLKALQQTTSSISVTPNQFLQITGLDPQVAFSALSQPNCLPGYGYVC
ncbi:MAG: hypothetical protein AAFU53_19430 [Cyanobacteria bacterium J06632_3]